jgi:hypothetical protein
MNKEKLAPFAKGGRSVDRNPGTRVKRPKMLPEATLFVAELIGEDGKGKGGLAGFLTRMAKKNPQSFAALLSRVPPRTALATVPTQVPRTVEEIRAELRRRGGSPQTLRAMARRWEEDEARDADSDGT